MELEENSEKTPAKNEMNNDKNHHHSESESMTTFEPIIYQLPNDTVLVILSFLTVGDWGHLRLVNKSWSWYELTGDDTIWQPVFDGAIRHPIYDPIRAEFLKEIRTKNKRKTKNNHVVKRKMDDNSGVEDTCTVTVDSSSLNDSSSNSEVHDGYRRQLLRLRQCYRSYLSEFIKRRKMFLSPQKYTPRNNLVYYGMEGIEQFFASKVQTKQDIIDLLGEYDESMVHDESYYSDRHYGDWVDNGRQLDLKSQGSIKLIAIGDSKVGKTCLLMRAMNGTFIDGDKEYVPRMLDNQTVTVDYWGKRHVHIWDAYDGDPYARMLPLTYPFTSVFVVCFSVVHQPSFERVAQKWLLEISYHCPHAAIILVGTMADLRDSPQALKHMRTMYASEPITPEEGEQMARNHKCIAYIETSARTGHNIDDMHLLRTAVQASLLGLHANHRPPQQTTAVLNKKCCIC